MNTRLKRVTRVTLEMENFILRMFESNELEGKAEGVEIIFKEVASSILLYNTESEVCMMGVDIKGDDG